jgi:hypothetical protein
MGFGKRIIGKLVCIQEQIKIGVMINGGTTLSTKLAWLVSESEANALRGDVLSKNVCDLMVDELLLKILGEGQFQC